VNDVMLVHGAMRLARDGHGANRPVVDAVYEIANME
jgi:hypothetical protein